jgi:HK97 family phage major capsid protein
MSTQDKRNKRSTLAKQLHALVKDHPKDEAWTSEHQKKYDNMVAEIEQLDGELTREQKALDLQASVALSNQERADRHGISLDEAEQMGEDARAAYSNYLRGGVEALSDEQRTLLNRRLQNPNNTMSTTTGSEGGFLTQEELAPEIAVAMKAYGGMRQIARVVPTSTGSTIPWPTSDATSETGEWLGQNSEANDEDTSFGVRNIDMWKASSKTVAVPFELLQDSQFDIIGHVNDIIGMRLGRVTEDAFINGSGTNQPHGLLADITAGKVGGSTTMITYDDIIDLQHSVDPAYRNSAGCGFMFHDQTLKVLRKLKDSEGRPLWLPGIAGNDPATLAGKQYVINQHMPQMAANAKSVAFGDFSKYIVRDMSQMMFFRFTDSAYTRKGQVGFLAMMRCGGRYVDVGGAIKYFQNAAS